MARVASWSLFQCLLTITVILQLLLVTKGAPAADLVPRLPGQPYDVPFKQYAGYITVDQTQGRNLFYYFVEAENSSSTKPLALWLNGGPGCSSLLGAFTELGPFYPNSTGNGLNVNIYSWNQVANVIFLESPAGVGFSYSENASDYFTDDARTAQDAVAFLLGWLAEYPEYSSRDFYLTGESYAGHYVPELAAAILQNNNVSGQVQIPLKGIMVGNPLFDAVTDLEYSPVEYGWGHGMVSEPVHDIIVQECNYTSPTRTQACLEAEFAASIQMGGNSSYVDPYDILADVCLTQGSQAIRLKAMFAGKDSLSDPCIGNDETEYLNLPDVQNALHAKPTIWQQCFDGSYYNYSDIYIPISPMLADLVAANLRVWVYTGDLDTVVSLIGTRKLIYTLSKTLNLNTTSDYQLWFQDSQVGGWTVSWNGGSVVYSTVRGASHMAPATQPARALVLITSFLAGDMTPPLQPQ
ncbi:unnamed protein product [Calypogeia fissa]